MPVNRGTPRPEGAAPDPEGVRPPAITDLFIEQVTRAVQRGRRVLRRLPGGGTLHLDRTLPCLLLYRFQGDHPDRSIQELITGESTFLVFPAGEQFHEALQKLIRGLGALLAREFGAFLLLEVWPAEDSRTFVIHGPPTGAASTVQVLERELLRLREVRAEVHVEARSEESCSPPYAPPVLPATLCQELGALTLGLEVPVLSTCPETGASFPVFHRLLRRTMSRALREALYDFIRVQTRCEVSSAHVLGRKTLEGSVRLIDRKLAQIEASYPFLLLILPVNSIQAWQEFQASRYEKPPHFQYRLLPVDPEELKRRLYQLNIGAVEDPVLAQLLRDKREELDIQITMLAERDTSRFRHSSIRLYHGVEPGLVRAAEGILTTVPPAARPERPAAEPAEAASKARHWVDAEQFRQAAQAEFDRFRQQYPGMPSRIELRDDIVGLMVSHGTLLIDRRLKIRPERLEALIQHEVGTHVLTYCNGHAQPLRQLATGLDDYDELQEGLAVMAEYLVGQLDRARLRLLAARVVAAHCLVEDASFTEAFRQLRDTYGFQPRTCFDVATRVYTGGGFIKDVIYLRGLVRLMEYLRAGQPIEPLYVGKIDLKHVPVIEELRARQILKEIPLKPHYLTTEAGQARLQRLRDGLLLPAMVS